VIRVVLNVHGGGNTNGQIRCGDLSGSACFGPVKGTYENDNGKSRE
jgi:hypothetical protein